MDSMALTVYYKGNIMTDCEVVNSFDEINLNEIISSNLSKMSFSQMTPIQKYSISHIINGKDVIGCAETGTGKTVAFLLPIINQMIHDGPPKGSSNFYF